MPDLFVPLWPDMDPAPLPDYALERPPENPLARVSRGVKAPKVEKTVGGKTRKVRTNPMLAKHGQLSPGEVCANCAHLDAGEYHNQRYLKCELWGYTHSTGSDFRASWPACTLFAQRDPQAPAILATRKTVKVPCTHPGCTQEAVVRVWYANTRSYARHWTEGARGRKEHVVKVVIAADGTVVSSQHGW